MWQVTRTVAVDGPASPDVVWSRYREPARWNEWAPHLSRVRATTAVIAPGTTGRLAVLGVVPAHFRVLQVDEAARWWSWLVSVGPVRLRLRHEVLARDGGSAAPVTLTGPAPAVVPYLPLARWALRRLVS